MIKLNMDNYKRKKNTINILKKLNENINNNTYHLGEKTMEKKTIKLRELKENDLEITRYLYTIMDYFDGNITRTARYIGITRQTVHAILSGKFPSFETYTKIFKSYNKLTKRRMIGSG